MVKQRTPARMDPGSVLVLTLILTLILAAVGLVLTRYVITGLRTSDTATERTDTNFDAANVMNWAIEEFSKKNLRPQDCGDAPAYNDITALFPSTLTTNGSTTTLECARTLPAAEPVVHLIATSVGEQTRVVEATLAVPRYTHGARVSDWRVDIPIDVLPYASTTTVAPTTTTTTTTPNVPPTATDTPVTVNPGPPSTQSVIASDADGTILTVSFTGVPANLTLTPLGGGTSFTLANDGTPGTYSVPFQVQDDDLAWSNTATLTIEVTSAATTTTVATTTTTTTTLAPNPACTFTVTSAAGDNKSGLANLAITNTGGEFTGWQVLVNWPGSWSASWDPLVTASAPSPNVTVSGAQTVGQSVTLNFSATLTWTSGNPKIFVNATRSCTVLSP